MKNKLLRASQDRIQKFTKLLRQKLLDDGCHKSYVNSLSEQQILNDFRVCADCDDELHTKSQQMHAILEFDTPERAFEVLFEVIDEDDEELYLLELEEDKDDIEDLEIVRGKWILEGCDSIEECIASVKCFQEHLEELRDSGYELIQPVEDDYGCLNKNDEI